MMPEITPFLTLLTVHIIALMSPGPDFALVVQHAGKYGRKIGIYIALGLSAGILLHSIFSLTGASLLIRQHPQFFALLQFAGASYLLWLGIRALRSVRNSIKQHHQTADLSGLTNSTAKQAITTGKQAFSKGFLTNILNPKALIFFLSLLSTMVPADMTLQGKGLVIVVLWGSSFLWFGALAMVLTTPGFQKKLQRCVPYIDTACGLLFISIGTMIISRLTT